MMRLKKRTKLPFWQEDRSWIPCTVTMTNALLGVVAILYILGLDTKNTTFPMPAIIMIFAAMVCDTFDGLIARKLHAESLHGMNLDSFADLISFGLAPAVFVFHIAQDLHRWGPYGNMVLMAVTSFYVASTLWRLAQYNTMSVADTSDSKGVFTGLPSPAGAFVICSIALALDRMNTPSQLAAIVLVAYTLITGFLMISRFVYIHGKKIVSLGPRPIRLALLTLCIFAIFRFGIFAWVTLVHLYLFSGPLSERIRHQSKDPEMKTL